MLRPDFEKWGQSAEEMLRLSTEAEHARTRERCLALYMIGTRQSNATQWSGKIGRQNVTVQRWIYGYNARGIEALIYAHTGGPVPLFAQQSESK